MRRRRSYGLPEPRDLGRERRSYGLSRKWSAIQRPPAQAGDVRFAMGRALRTMVFVLRERGLCDPKNLGGKYV